MKFLTCLFSVVFVGAGMTSAQVGGRKPATMHGVFGAIRPTSAVTLLHVIERTTTIELEGLAPQKRQTVDLLNTSYRLEQSTEDETIFIVVINQAERRTLGDDGAVKSSQQIDGLRGLEIRVAINKDGSEPRIVNEGPVFMRLAKSDPKTNEMILGIYSPQSLLTMISKPFWLVPFVKRQQERLPKPSPIALPKSEPQGDESSGVDEPQDNDESPEAESSTGKSDDEAVNLLSSNTIDVVTLGSSGVLHFKVQLEQDDKSKEVKILGAADYQARDVPENQRLQIQDVKLLESSYTGNAILLPKPDADTPRGQISIRPNSINWFSSLTVNVDFTGSATVRTSAGDLSYRFQQERHHYIRSAQVLGEIPLPKAAAPPGIP